MSIATISYSSISKAQGEAKDVAKKLDAYASALNSSVYKKLNRYDGSWTGNISSARSSVGNKITELENEAEQYRTYAGELKDLKEECQRVDRAVRSKVSSLTATFKKSHGIKNSVIDNFLARIIVKRDNSTAIGRWISDKKDAFRSELSVLKQRIKKWYGYDGGKEVIKGVVVAALEIAIAVISIVSGVGWVAVLAGIIALADGVMNLVNEFKAYGCAANDPASARRRSELNTIADTIRADSDSKLLHMVAFGIDGVKLALAVTQFIKKGSELIKKGYKWVTNSVDDLARLDFKHMRFGHFMEGLGDRWSEIQTSFNTGGFKYAAKFGKNLLKNFMVNFKEEYFSISLDSIKNSLKFGKSLIKDGLSFGVFLEFVVGPVAVGNLTTAKVDASGKISVSFDQIHFNDFRDLADDFLSKILGSKVFKNEDIINMSKLSKIKNMKQINIGPIKTMIPKIPVVSYI